VVEEKEDIEEEEMKDVATASAIPTVVEEEMELVQEETDATEVQQEEPKRKEKRREGLVQERIISVSVCHIYLYIDDVFFSQIVLLKTVFLV
jgi:hypothetical protein